MAKMDREEETDIGVLGGGLLHVCDLPLLGLLGSPVVASRACVVKGGGVLGSLGPLHFCHTPLLGLLGSPLVASHS